MKDSPVFWFFGLTIPVCLAWWFRDREAKKSVRLKDLRSNIDTIGEQVDGIEELAVDYFLRPGNEEAVQRDGLKIKAKLKSVATRVNAIHAEINIGAAKRDFGLLTKLVAFRRAITLDDFDAAERLAFKANDLKFENISAAANKLKEALELVYQNCK